MSKLTEAEIKVALAMSEEEQRVWLSKQLVMMTDVKGRTGKISDWSLADLAFRWRDEAKKENKENWLRACFEVDNMAGNYKDGRIYNCNNGYTAESNILKRGPIHWILAALKAKENE